MYIAKKTERCDLKVALTLVLELSGALFIHFQWQSNRI